MNTKYGDGKGRAKSVTDDSASGLDMNAMKARAATAVVSNLAK